MLPVTETEIASPAPSPFLSGTKIQFAWDSTSLGYLKTCPRLYQYTMLDGWASKDESVHLRFGIEYHTSLQDYETLRAEGIPHENSIHETVWRLVERIRDWKVDTTTRAGKYKNPHSIISLVVDYLDFYGTDDPAKTYILANGKPAVELSFRFELEFGPAAALPPDTRDHVDPRDPPYEDFATPSQPYVLCGHLDRVVEFNGALLVMDHKTSMTTLSTHYFDGWSPHNQMTLYTLAGGVVLGTPVKGICISAAQIMIEQPHRFVRGFTYRTPDQLAEWINDLYATLRINELYASRDYWPMNDTSCDKFGGCKFREICSLSPMVREKFLASRFHKFPPEERWNPLRSR